MVLTMSDNQTPLENSKQAKNPAPRQNPARANLVNDRQANPALRQASQKTMVKTSPWCQTPKSKEKTQH
jgi:hypothetical protein